MPPATTYVHQKQFARSHSSAIASNGESSRSATVHGLKLNTQPVEHSDAVESSGDGVTDPEPSGVLPVNREDISDSGFQIGSEELEYRMRKSTRPHITFRSSSLTLPPMTFETMTLESTSPPSSPENCCPKFAWMLLRPVASLYDRTMSEYALMPSDNDAGPDRSPFEAVFDHGMSTDGDISGFSDQSSTAAEDRIPQAAEARARSRSASRSASRSTSRSTSRSSKSGRKKKGEFPSDIYHRRVSSIERRRLCPITAPEVHPIVPGIYLAELQDKKPPARAIDLGCDELFARSAFLTRGQEYYTDTSQKRRLSIPIKPSMTFRSTPIRHTRSFENLESSYDDTILDNDPSRYDSGFDLFANDDPPRSSHGTYRGVQFGSGTLAQRHKHEDLELESYENPRALAPLGSGRGTSISENGFHPSGHRCGFDSLPPSTPRMTFRRLSSGSDRVSNGGRGRISAIDGNESPRTRMNPLGRPAIPVFNNPYTSLHQPGSDVNSRKDSSSPIDFGELPLALNQSSQTKVVTDSTAHEDFSDNPVLNLFSSGKSATMSKVALLTAIPQANKILRRNGTALANNGTAKAATLGEGNLTVADAVGRSIQDTVADTVTFHPAKWGKGGRTRKSKSIQNNDESPSFSGEKSPGEVSPELGNGIVDGAVEEQTPLEFL